MKLQTELREKKKRKKRAKSLSSPPSFFSLPNDILDNCLARVPRSHYQELSLVSKSFRSLLSSQHLYAARSHLGNTQQCIYLCLWSSPFHPRTLFEWIPLSINPNQTKKNKICQFSAPFRSSSFAAATSPTVVGSEIYLFGGCQAPSSTVRVVDCLSHTWRNAPSMIVPRVNPLSCFYDGKIYVLGGITKLLAGKSLGEVFDIKTQTWERLPQRGGIKTQIWERLPQPGLEIHKGFFYKTTEFEGKIYFGSGDTMCNYYDPKQCKWDNQGATLPWPGCVMDNVSYSFHEHGGRHTIWWRHINSGDRKEVKGLELLELVYNIHGGSRDSTTKTASCGGKIYVMWKKYTKSLEILNIWCAQISLEKRDRDEIWGNVDWYEVVHTANTQCHLQHCLTLSL